jgi:serine/threonine protein kinase
MRIGARIADRFEIERLAASGGMGVVYRAHDLETGRPVAVKVIRNGGVALSPRLRREATVLAQLVHPHIVRHVAHGELPGGDFYLVMEWLAGRTLANLRVRKSEGHRPTLALMVQAADALAFAHARGITHRDITPGNLLVLDEPAADHEPPLLKVLDFGLAKMLHAEVALTRSNMVFGTVGYLSPEQACGDADVDCRSDVFSLGCVLYERLTGQTPFPGDERSERLVGTLFRDPASPRSFVPDLPESVEWLLFRMLAKSPGDRPDSATQVAHELRGLLGGERVAQPSTS